MELLPRPTGNFVVAAPIPVPAQALRTDYGPFLPAVPANNPFRINGRLLERYLDTVEVRSSSLLVPTIILSSVYAGLTHFSAS